MSGVMRVAGILLAAGRGTRFGGDKLVHPLPDAMPIVAASSKSLREGGVDLLVAVVESQSGSVAALLRDAGVTVVSAEFTPAGIGSSIAAGVQAARHADAWVLLPGDMPYVSPNTVRAVCAALREGHDLVAPYWRGQRGHPVGFAGRWKSALESLRGDVGGRHLLRDATVYPLTCEDGGVTRDIDVPEDILTDA